MSWWNALALEVIVDPINVYAIEKANCLAFSVKAPIGFWD